MQEAPTGAGKRIQDAAAPRLAAAISRHRDEVVRGLEQLPWLADPSRPTELVVGPKRVGPRVEAFLHAVLDGLRTGSWHVFDERIADPTVNLLVQQVITPDDLDERAVAITSILLPTLDDADQTEGQGLQMALFAAMQNLSSRILRAYNAHLADELRRLDEVKTMFLRVTGHELRAPLSVVSGYASMLQEGSLGELPTEAQGAVNQISDAARRSLNLLDRLVEVARLEGAAEALSCAPCSLREIVENALQSLREQIRDQGIKLEIAVAEDDAVVDADELAIAVRNLVGNALKYGGSGGSIRVQAAVRGDQAVFEVADQGPGIAPDELPRVFDRYFRSTRSRQAGIEGSGLGLFIVKRIVELHGGHVEAESRVGAGSTFRIEIPATPTG